MKEIGVKLNIKDMETKYYIGQITSVNNDYSEVNGEDGLLKRNYQQIVATIPGFIERVVAMPIKGMNDEPKVGDTVLLYCLDPIFHSHYIYQVLKENDFIGIRAAGKLVEIAEDKVRIAVYEKDMEYKEDDVPGSENEADRKERLKASITLKEDGSIEIYSEKGITISNGTPMPQIEVPEDGADLPEVGANNGPFNAICQCPYLGILHSSNTITETFN